MIKTFGALYISTVGPDHEIYKRGELIGAHRFRVRDLGKQLFFLDTERYLQCYCGVRERGNRPCDGKAHEASTRLPRSILPLSKNTL